MASLAEVIADLRAEIAELRRRIENGVRHGTVEPGSLDAEKGTVRLRIGGTDEKPWLSPPVRYGQIAGALKLHQPPSDGQQMTLFSPSGDIRQAVAMPFGWSDQNKSPSTKADENVLTFGSVRVELRGEELVLKLPKIAIDAGGTTFNLSAEGLKSFAVAYDMD